MQTARRDYSRNAVAGFGSPPPPPPPAPLRVVKNASDVPPAASAREAVDPKWLEDAVLRILKKHAVVPVVGESEDLEEFFELQRPSRLWRFTRAVLVLALIAGAAAFVARWRYPAQTGAAIAFARGAIAKIPFAPPLTPAPSAPAPSPESVVPAIDSLPPAATTPALTAAPVATPAPAAPNALADAKLIPPPPSAVETKPSSIPVSPLPPAKTEPKPAVVHATHAPSRAPVAAATPVSAPPETPAPIPGSLGDAIRRAGGTMPTPAPDRAPAPEQKSSDSALPDRPPASLVTSALLGALPDARACLGAGEETKAIVVFESSGAVSSVQVSGASAACIQKAFAHAHVPAFSQPTYRAGVPIRGN